MLGDEELPVGTTNSRRGVDLSRVRWGQLKRNIDLAGEFFQGGEIDREAVTLADQLKPQARGAYLAIARAQDFEYGEAVVGPRADRDYQPDRRFLSELALLNQVVTPEMVVDSKTQAQVARAFVWIGSVLEWAEYYRQAAAIQLAQQEIQNSHPFLTMLSNQGLEEQSMLGGTVDRTVIERLRYLQRRKLDPILVPATFNLWDEAGVLESSEWGLSAFDREIGERVRAAARILVAGQELMSDPSIVESEELRQLQGGRLIVEVKEFTDGWLAADPVLTESP